MRTAASYINRRRVLAEASLTKVQYPGSVAVHNPLISAKNFLANFGILKYNPRVCCNTSNDIPIPIPICVPTFDNNIFDGGFWSTGPMSYFDGDGTKSIFDGNATALLLSDFGCVFDGMGNFYSFDGNQNPSACNLSILDGDGICEELYILSCIFDGLNSLKEASKIFDGNELHHPIFQDQTIFDGGASLLLTSLILEDVELSTHVLDGRGTCDVLHDFEILDGGIWITNSLINVDGDGNSMMLDGFSLPHDITFHTTTFDGNNGNIWFDANYIDELTVLGYYNQVFDGGSSYSVYTYILDGNGNLLELNANYHNTQIILDTDYNIITFDGGNSYSVYIHIIDGKLSIPDSSLSLHVIQKTLDTNLTMIIFDGGNSYSTYTYIIDGNDGSIEFDGNYVTIIFDGGNSYSIYNHTIDGNNALMYLDAKYVTSIFDGNIGGLFIFDGTIVPNTIIYDGGNYTGYYVYTIDNNITNVLTLDSSLSTTHNRVRTIIDGGVTEMFPNILFDGNGTEIIIDGIQTLLPEQTGTIIVDGRRLIVEPAIELSSVETTNVYDGNGIKKNDTTDSILEGGYFFVDIQTIADGNGTKTIFDGSRGRFLPEIHSLIDGGYYNTIYSTILQGDDSIYLLDGDSTWCIDRLPISKVFDGNGDCSFFGKYSIIDGLYRDTLPVTIIDCSNVISPIFDGGLVF